MKGLWLLPFLAVPAFAQLHWNDRQKEFHVLQGSTNLVARYTFTNSGTNDVIITSIQSSCSCCTTVSSDRKTYHPADKGVVTVIFNTAGRIGAQDRTITVSSNDPEEPRATLKLLVKISSPTKIEAAKPPAPLIQIKPVLLEWKKGEQKDPKTILLDVTGDKPIHVLSVKSDNAKLVPKLQTLIAGQAYTIMVTPANTATPAKGTLQIETDASEKNWKTITVPVAIVASARKKS